MLGYHMGQYPESEGIVTRVIYETREGRVEHDGERLCWYGADGYEGFADVIGDEHDQARAIARDPRAQTTAAVWECVYCGATGDYPEPAIPSDDAGWIELAGQHATACEWIATRAQDA